MPYEPPPALASLSLAELTALADGRDQPPLEKWAPQRTGDSEMRIAADGAWFHQGGRITRPAMVRAFARLIMRDAAGQHWLVTPAERLTIAVDDAAFIAIDMEARTDERGAPVLAFQLNTDDLLLLGPDHRLRVGGSADQPAFYLAVRHGAEARLNRSTYGQLIDHALAVSAPDALAVESLGQRFALVPPA
ncbi:DUF1285 domain-containing protein [Novosphingobium sp. Chol11]|uniref:DUF1285 domain-containing protein n=1 Tax=Novosphingobium sp. Chol11 TaxID=1385763 RepID=UPI0025DE36E1|nr:DUF1285 domain-containing protein [Novosphingobium sp. Chol11]